MTIKKESEPLVKVTLNLYQEDWRRLQEIFPYKNASLVVRRMLRSYIIKVNNREILTKDL